MWRAISLTYILRRNELSQPNPTTTQQQLNLTRLRLDSIIKPNPPHPPHKLSYWSRGFWNDRSRLLIGRELVQLPLAETEPVDLPGASMTSAWCEADNRLSEELATEVYRQVQEGPDRLEWEPWDRCEADSRLSEELATEVYRQVPDQLEWEP